LAVCPYVYTGVRNHYFLLNGGDEVVPEFAEKCTALLHEYSHLHPTMVICETDVRNEDNTITAQKPMFDDDCIINGESSPEVYYLKGYNHRAICFYGGYNHNTDKSYRTMVSNDLTVWSNLLYANFKRNAIYVHSKMATLKNREYNNPIYTICTRYVMLMFHQRYMQSILSNPLDVSDYESASKNLADNAMHFSEAEAKRGNNKSAEDLRLLAKIINYKGDYNV